MSGDIWLTSATNLSTIRTTTFRMQDARLQQQLIVLATVCLRQAVVKLFRLYNATMRFFAIFISNYQKK
jgi:hypothetical protein